MVENANIIQIILIHTVIYKHSNCFLILECLNIISSFLKIILVVATLAVKDTLSRH